MQIRPSAMEPTIFHFNCPFCGAHPEPVLLMEFLDAWRACPESDFDALLEAYRRILMQIAAGGARWKTKKFTRALDNIVEWFGPADTNEPPPIDSQTGKGLVALVECPLCLTDRGLRPYDKYFAVWRSACKVQVANLLYESGIIIFAILKQLPKWATPERLGRLGNLLALNLRLLASMGLLECPFCGRHTTCLYGDGSPENPHRCRWCIDRAGGFKIRLSISDDLTIRLESLGESLPEKLCGNIIPSKVILVRRKAQKPKKTGE